MRVRTLITIGANKLAVIRPLSGADRMARDTTFSSGRSSSLLWSSGVNASSYAGSSALSEAMRKHKIGRIEALQEHDRSGGRAVHQYEAGLILKPGQAGGKDDHGARVVFEGSKSSSGGVSHSRMLSAPEGPRMLCLSLRNWEKCNGLPRGRGSEWAAQHSFRSDPFVELRRQSQNRA